VQIGPAYKSRGINLNKHTAAASRLQCGGRACATFPYKCECTVGNNLYYLICRQTFSLLWNVVVNKMSKKASNSNPVMKVIKFYERGNHLSVCDCFSHGSLFLFCVRGLQTEPCLFAQFSVSRSL
jgi:hypothetical protein